MNPIDVVITWVDGNDPKHKEKVNLELGNRARKNIPGANSKRFESADEIKYCVLSILKFAPFVRNIFIVTDEQDPNLNEIVEKYFPSRSKTIRIVDHKEIFRGFEENLPTFNNRSIGTMIWRIDGLADKYVHFNDDIFLIRDVTPDMWFNGDRPIINGSWKIIPLHRIFYQQIRLFVKRSILGNKEWEPRAAYHMGQWISAYKAGFRLRYFCFDHTPKALNNNIAKEYFENNPQDLKTYSSFKFRNYKQIVFQSLFYHLEILKGNRNFQKPNLVYVQPLGRNSEYMSEKLRECETSLNTHYLCVQDLESSTKTQKYEVFEWLKKLIES